MHKLNSVAVVDAELTLKTTPPRLAKSCVDRAALALDSDRLRDHAVIAVHAPAGYGKTALLVQWRREALRRGATVVWLTLDDHDSEDRVIRGLRLALRTGRGHAPAAAPDWIAAQQTAMEAATTWLADVVDMGHDVVLLVDDVQALRDAASVALLAYVTLNAPANLVVALASRMPLPEALARHIANRPLEHGDLRLSFDETRRIVEAQSGRRPDASMCARLYELSGGWPLGLQLLLSTAAGRAEAAADSDSPLFEPGHIARYFRTWLDEALTPELRDLLLRLSIIDNVNPALAVALTGDADAGRLLEHLCAVTPIFGQGFGSDWVQTHALARDFLRSQAKLSFSPEQFAASHARASAWFAANGMPEQATQHAFHAGQTALAYDLAETCMHQVAARGDFQSVLEWFDRIPAEEIRLRPRVVLPASWAMGFFATRRVEGQMLLRQVMADAEVSIDVRAEAAAASLVSLVMQDDAQGAQDLHDAWLAHVGQGHALLDQAMTFHRAMSLMNQGEPGMAAQLYERGISTASTQGFFLTRMVIAIMAANIHYWQGRLGESAAEVQPELDAVEASFGRRSPAAVHLCVGLARVRWEQGDTEGAAALLADRLDVIERAHSYRVTMLGLHTAACIALDAGDEVKALAMTGRLFALGELRRQPRLCLEALREEIRIHARSSRGKTCADLLGRMESLVTDLGARPRSYAEPMMQVRLQLARGHAHLAAGRHRQAEAAAAEAHRLAAQLKHVREIIESMALLAVINRRLGEDGDAWLREAVSLADALGFKRLVGDTHPDLATAAARPGAASDAGADQRIVVYPTALLTPKERVVLGCLGEGHSNKRIATILAVSDETVKWHVKNVMEKLDATDRKNAVLRARHIGIMA
jgi:LuxR family transcriptional regulator, maltose regulon positive regulatory protein